MKCVPPEAISDLRRRLFSLAPRSTERRLLVEETAGLYGVSTDTLYRALRERAVPKALRRMQHRLEPHSEAGNGRLDFSAIYKMLE